MWYSHSLQNNCGFSIIKTNKQTNKNTRTLKIPVNVAFKRHFPLDFNFHYKLSFLYSDFKITILKCNIVIEKLKQKEKKLLTLLNIYPSQVFFTCALSNWQLIFSKFRLDNVFPLIFLVGNAETLTVWLLYWKT